MSDTTETFDAIYNSITDAKWQIAVGRNSIAEVISDGVSRSMFQTSQGIGRGVTGSLRFKLADDIDGTAIGDVIQAKPQADTAWQSFRIAGRGAVGGVVKLELENPDE